MAALDPFRGYGSALSAWLPHAMRVVDAFHVVRPGLAAVDDVRRRIHTSRPRRFANQLGDEFASDVAHLTGPGRRAWRTGPRAPLDAVCQRRALLAIMGQSLLGMRGQLALRVPLGVAIAGLVATLLVGMHPGQTS